MPYRVTLTARLLTGHEAILTYREVHSLAYRSYPGQPAQAGPGIAA